jgi:hypothetical protein
MEHNLYIDNIDLTLNQQKLPITLYRFLNDALAQASVADALYGHGVVLQFSADVPDAHKKDVLSLLKSQGVVVRKNSVRSWKFYALGAGVFLMVGCWAAFQIAESKLNQHIDEINSKLKPVRHLSPKARHTHQFEQAYSLLQAPGIVDLISITPSKIVIKVFVPINEWEKWVEYFDSLLFVKQFRWNVSTQSISNTYRYIFLVGEYRD